MQKNTSFFAKLV